MKHLKLYIAGIALTAISCSEYTKSEQPKYTLDEAIYVDKLPNKDYKLTIYEKGDWKIYSGTSTTTIDWSKPIKTVKNSIEIKNPSPEKRMFFAAVNNQDTLYLSEREIDMEDAVNFRDMGGIITAEGKEVKWGMLFRSGELAELSKEDLAHMKLLNIKAILDLRSDYEIDEKPDKYPNGTTWKHLEIGNSGNKDMKEMMKQLKDADPATFDADKIMEDFNEKFMESSDNLRQIFKELLKNDSNAILFHCTAGKDRTGFVAAMILSALGVDEKTILQEYELSNYFRYEANEDMIEKAATYYGIDQRILRPMMGVKAQYLIKGLTAIKNKYGSVHNYLTTEIGLDSVQLQHLQGKYLY